MKRYNNYHKHTCYSNLRTLDVITKPIDYINRAKELGHTTYFTTEHGWGGNLWEAYSLCKENGLRCIFGVEAYYVDDRFNQDKSNNHIILISKNFEGYKDLNRIISEANKTGYYYKPRIDLELLLSLNPKNIIVTTACVASRLFKSENYEEEFLVPIHNYFKNNLYLEVQCHEDNYQVEYNKKIKMLSQKHNIKMIHANDSHYIYKEDSKYRDLFLKAKGIVYEGESNFVLDYPSYNEIIERYKKTMVFTNDEIEEIIDNTIIFDECEDLDLKDDIKLPKIHKDKNSNELMKEILNKQWKMEKKEISSERHKEYLDAIKYEMDIVTKTSMEDYFILDYEIVKRAKEVYGGVLTRTGRGSAPSFYINKLLGLTDIDRLESPITLYPTRFMSTTRILKTRSLPDIDMNWANVEPCIKASKDILGDDGVYYMIAFKSLQESSAFRLWCKANDMDINEYNEIAKNLDSYVNDKKWGKVIEESKVFRGVVESVSPSPCSFLLMDKPISEEVGLIKVGDIICCCLDGYNCDKYKFLKNDYLTVSVWDIIDKTFKLINRPIPTIRELNKILDNTTWDMYRLGLTSTLNQADSDFATPLIKKYACKTVAEISAWVASIRPGFASLLNNFIERKPYTTGVKELDNLLHDSYHYLLYQESIMKYLVWLGIEESGTYDIIKKIAKKKFKEAELTELKKELLNGWTEQVGTESGFEETWQVIEDASKYSFNASHSLSVGYDSLYGAYLKSHYPLEYYSVVLNHYKDDTERTKKIVSELNYFDIKFNNAKYGYSKGECFFNKKTNSIYKGVGSIKNLNNKVGDELYELSQNNEYDNLLDLFIDIQNNTTCNSRQLETLIKLDYFDIFGKSQKVLDCYKYFKLLYNKKSPKKATLERDILDTSMLKFVENNSTPTNSTYGKLDWYNALTDIFKNIKDDDMSFLNKLSFQNEILGYIDYKNNSLDKRYALITSVNTKYTPVVDTYCLNNGVTCKCKISKKIWNHRPLQENDVIYINSMKRKFGCKKVGEDKKGKPIFEEDQSTFVWWIEDYNVVNLDEVVANEG